MVGLTKFAQFLRKVKTSTWSMVLSNVDESQGAEWAKALPQGFLGASKRNQLKLDTPFPMEKTEA